MNKAALSEQIEIFTRREMEKKSALEDSFAGFKRDIMPREIAKRAVKRGVVTLRSFLAHFSFGSNSKHG